MSETPVETLELKAMQERSRLHQSVEELKAHYTAAREKLDVKKNARQHLLGATVAVSVFGLVTGYAFAGIFTRH